MKKIWLALCFVFVLSACGNNNNHSGSSSVPPELVELEVSVEITPESIQPGDTVTIAAEVSLEGEPVEDASEVQFEVWKKGQEEHEMIPLEAQDKNMYSIAKTFEEEGIYYVVSHVTARNAHRMPKTEFIVGNPPESTDADTESDESHMEEPMDGHEGQHEH
ncbi:FixH family protein [Marinicrinis lubricantis]|uniref:FixH family protein n=1 Tax=Marinicrinis lubricantis TaxID=2086470 RepID=A0ABW1IVF7_9BACL